MDIKTLTELYRHMEWADAAVWVAVLASDGGQADAKLRDYLYHLHLVQRAFLRVWRNEPLPTQMPTFDDAQSLMQWGRAYHGEARAHLETLSDERLSETFIMPWAGMVENQLGRKPEPSTLGDTVLQVNLHSLYHRGQVNARLKEVGGAPPLVDYIAWIWLGRPAANWP